MPTLLAQNLIACPDGSMADPSVGCVAVPGNIVNPNSGLAELILKIASVAMSTAAGLAMLFLVYGGIRYALARGEEDKIQEAKRILFWSVAGLVVSLLARYVAEFILSVVK